MMKAPRPSFLLYILKQYSKCFKVRKFHKCFYLCFLHSDKHISWLWHHLMTKIGLFFLIICLFLFLGGVFAALTHLQQFLLENGLKWALKPLHIRHQNLIKTFFSSLTLRCNKLMSIQLDRKLVLAGRQLVLDGRQLVLNGRQLVLAGIQIILSHLLLLISY
jgi:hypothetical protein